MHKTSRKIVNYCLDKNIDTIVIVITLNGNQNVNLGKKNNQNFVFIPFQSLIYKIKYKAEEEGIYVKVIKEWYTSKCSFIDSEPVKKHQRYLSRRVKRGLYRNVKGLFLNADINVAGNIGRKVFPMLFFLVKNTK